jgi:hypothetical protein
MKIKEKLDALQKRGREGLPKIEAWSKQLFDADPDSSF